MTLTRRCKVPLPCIPLPSDFSGSESMSGLAPGTDGGIVTNDLWSVRVLKCRRRVDGPQNEDKTLPPLGLF